MSSHILFQHFTSIVFFPLKLFYGFSYATRFLDSTKVRKPAGITSIPFCVSLFFLLYFNLSLFNPSCSHPIWIHYFELSQLVWIRSIWTASVVSIHGGGANTTDLGFDPKKANDRYVLHDVALHFKYKWHVCVT